MTIQHEQQPFDLDRMCQEAKERLHSQIDASAKKEMYGWAMACYERALRDAIRFQIEKSLASLRLDMLFTGWEQGGAFVEYKTLEHA